MLEYLKGTVITKNLDRAVIEVNNIGYSVNMPLLSLGKLIIKEEVKVYTHLHVREDAFEIYGFLDENERSVFLMLINVNKVGPKVAMSIMSTFDIEELISAILNEDAKKLSKAPGIGNKTAQKIILDMKDKLSKFLVESDITDIEINDDGSSADSSIVEESIMALMSLGYLEKDARKAVNTALSKDKNPDSLLTNALKYL